MQGIKNTLKSRTVWTIILFAATNITEAYANAFTPEQMTLINTLIGALAIYFRVNPKQTF